MILIDLGNTRLKWQARSSKGEIQARGAGCHEHGMRLTELAAELGREVQDRGPVSVASVAGDVLEGMLTRVLERLGFAPAGIMFVKAESARAGVRSGYRDPARLGADRWAALIGTWAKHHRASLILSLGTAITLDVLDDEGVHRGGLIAPGRGVLARALAWDTAQLPEVMIPGVRFLANDTESALANGSRFMIDGFVAASDACATRLLATDPIRIVTGGDAEFLDPDLLQRWQMEPDLVFDGLARLAEAS